MPRCFEFSCEEVLLRTQEGQPKRIWIFLCLAKKRHTTRNNSVEAAAAAATAAAVFFRRVKSGGPQQRRVFLCTGRKSTDFKSATHFVYGCRRCCELNFHWNV